MNFLTLRNHEHAQPEIQVYAQAIEKMISKIYELNYSWDIFKKMRIIDHLLLKLLINIEGWGELEDYLTKFIETDNSMVQIDEGTNTKKYE